MKSMTVLVGAATLAIGIAAGALLAQPPPQPGPQPFSVGNRLGLPIDPAADGAFDAMSSNVKVYGAIYSAESCSYDPGPRRHRRAESRRRRRTCRPTTRGSRSSTTTARSTPRAGSASRIPARARPT